MEFLSIPFTVFIVITILLYYAGKGKRWQHGLLLTASIIFIGYYHLQYLLYAIGITLFTFYAGKLLHKKKEDKSASWIFVGSLAVLVGVWLTARYWSPIFPLGISFYTFQALSYLIEIYWDEEPEESLLDFTLYMMLFMKFLSGPIERGYELLPQLKKAHAFDYDKAVYGLKLIAWGAFLKLVIADRIAPASVAFVLGERLCVHAFVCRNPHTGTMGHIPVHTRHLRSDRRMARSRMDLRPLWCVSRHRDHL
jgi:alginate O-acetyltransferase complex protein AlgI